MANIPVLPTNGIPTYLRETNKAVNGYYNMISEQHQQIVAHDDDILNLYADMVETVIDEYNALVEV